MVIPLVEFALIAGCRVALVRSFSLLGKSGVRGFGWSLFRLFAFQFKFCRLGDTPSDRLMGSGNKSIDTDGSSGWFVRSEPYIDRLAAWLMHSQLFPLCSYFESWMQAQACPMAMAQQLLIS